MRHPCVAVFLVVLIVSLPCPAYGWWDTGHMLVAQIAWNHLNKQASPTVLAAVSNAVTSLQVYSDTSNTFVTAACWMDDLKENGMYQFSNWHFIDIPICVQSNDTDIDACNGVSVTSLLNSDYTVVWAIDEAMTTIKSSWAGGFERGFAL